MGFSPWGLAVALVVLAPNLLIVWFPPRTPIPTADVPRPLRWLERAGQALCVIIPVITEPGGFVTGWLIPLLAAVVGYYALWARYLLARRSGRALYQPWWVIPVPMALLPVVAFLSAAAWLTNPWIALAAAILAAGHVPASLIIARAARSQP